MNRKKAPTSTFRITSELARKIRIISAAKKMSVPDYVTELFGPVIEKEYARFARGVAKEVGKSPEAE